MNHVMIRPVAIPSAAEDGKKKKQETIPGQMSLSPSSCIRYEEFIFVGKIRHAQRTDGLCIFACLNRRSPSAKIN